MLNGEWANSNKVGLVIGHHGPLTTNAGFDLGKFTLGYLNAAGMLPGNLSGRNGSVKSITNMFTDAVHYGLYEYLMTHYAGNCSMDSDSIRRVAKYQQWLSDIVKRFSSYLSRHPGNFTIDGIYLDHEYTALTWTNEHTWWVDHILGVKHQGDREVPYIYATDAEDNLWAIKPPLVGTLPRSRAMLSIVGVHDYIWLQRYNNTAVLLAGKGDTKHTVDWYVKTYSLRREQVAGPEWNTP
jgi:hypothetical protein